MFPSGIKSDDEAFFFLAWRAGGVTAIILIVLTVVSISSVLDYNLFASEMDSPK